jgi:hypothetical protein
MIGRAVVVILVNEELAGARSAFGNLYGESEMKVRGRIRWG